MSLENLSVWTIPPNWSESVTETLEWLTDVLASPIGAEQRIALRRTPRRSFEMTFTPNGPIRTLFDMFVERAGGSDIYLPIWHDSNRLAIDSSGSDLTIQSATDTEFVDCPAVFIQGANPFDYEIAEFASIASDTITVVDPLAQVWPAGTRVFPMQKCHIDTQPQASRKADRTYQVRVKFSSVNPNPCSSTISLGTYLSDGVLEIEPNDVQDLTYEYQRMLAELDNQTGKRARVDLNPWGYTVQQFTFFNRGRAAYSSFRALLYTLQGRLMPVWVPTFFADFDLVGPTDGFTFDIKRCGYTDFAGPFTGRQYILIHLRDGSRLYREIVSSVLVGGGTTERITLADEIYPPLTPSDVYRISFLSGCRLDQDSIEIVHHTDTHGVSTATALFRSLPQTRLFEPVIPDPEPELRGSVYVRRTTLLQTAGPLSGVGSTPLGIYSIWYRQITAYPALGSNLALDGDLLKLVTDQLVLGQTALSRYTYDSLQHFRDFWSVGGNTAFPVYGMASSSVVDYTMNLLFSPTGSPGDQTLILSDFNPVSIDEDDGTWHHIIWAWDLSGGDPYNTVHVYVDGVSRRDIANDVIGSVPFTTIDYSDDPVNVLGFWPSVNSVVNGMVAELYFAPGQFLDLSNPANLAKFYDGGFAVQLGADGSTPTGTAPSVYLRGGTSEFLTNQGTGGALNSFGSGVASVNASYNLTINGVNIFSGLIPAPRDPFP